MATSFLRLLPLYLLLYTSGQPGVKIKRPASGSVSTRFGRSVHAYQLETFNATQQEPSRLLEVNIGAHRSIPLKNNSSDRMLVNTADTLMIPLMEGIAGSSQRGSVIFNMIDDRFDSDIFITSLWY